MVVENLSEYFFGLSAEEKKAIIKLEWQKSKFADVNLEESIFIISDGKLINENGTIHGIGTGPFGVTPFCVNKPQRYKELDPVTVFHIPTKSLANFFLENPKAMQSFIMCLDNAGYGVLEKWKKKTRVIGFQSIQSPWQTLHFAYHSCYDLGKSEESCIFLEFNPEGMSIFSLLSIEAPPSIMLSGEDDKSLSQILSTRTIKHEKFDILNVQHLSIWKMDKKQWSSLYWELRENYNYIILHVGEYTSNFMYEQLDMLYIMRKMVTLTTAALHVENNNVLWPIRKEIFTNQTLESNTETIYPLHYTGTVNITEVLKEDNLNESYWDWIKENFLDVMLTKKASVLSSHGINNFEKLIEHKSEMPFINNGEHDNEWTLKNDTIYFAEGTMGFYSVILSTAKAKKALTWFRKKFSIENLASQLKPIYPKTGFYSLKSFKNMFGKNAESCSIGISNVNLLAFSEKHNSVLTLTCGNMLENLSVSCLPYGTIEGTIQDTHNRNLRNTNKSHWYHIMAYLYRVGFNQIIFYDVSNDIENNKASFLTSIFLEKSYTTYNDRISGKHGSIKKIVISENNDSI